MMSRIFCDFTMLSADSINPFNDSLVRAALALFAVVVVVCGAAAIAIEIKRTKEYIKKYCTTDKSASEHRPAQTSRSETTSSIDHTRVGP